ncbi:EAL domain-containing protein [uncultured Halopseudomonas sp.]|uniref:putative bifunctional diguanylate cyclase/phosphodiesterase n=1 Tax=uncultured Halopseudomonas sp. TaxID=2901193 RepID=UPI0030EEFF7D|tara:strand:- start:29561 stop:32419 length:2859 start_codon:yes stop_codon:yes gene_type:complete
MTFAPITPPAVPRQHLRLRALDMLFAFARLPQWLIMFNAVAMLPLLWVHTSHVELLVWMAVLGVLTLQRMMLVRRYQSAPDAHRVRLRWPAMLYLGNLTSGLCLGWIYSALVPVDNFMLQAPAYALTAGITLCVSVIYAFRYIAFLAFTVPALLMPSIYLLLQNDASSPYWGLMGSILFSCLLMGAVFINRSLGLALKASLHNEQLVARLEESRRQTEDLNYQLTQEIQQRRQAEQGLRDSHGVLEERVALRTAELEEASAALKSSETQLTLAMDASQLGLWDWNLETDEVVHSHLLEIFGMPPDSVTFMRAHLSPRVHPDDSEMVRDTLVSHMRMNTGSYRIEYRVKHANGQWIWVEDSGRAVERDANGRVRRMIGTRRDISARKIQDEQAQLAATVFEATAEGIFILDPDLRILTVNNAFSAITGYAAEDVLGLPIADTNKTSKNQLSFKALCDILENNDRWEGERISQRRSGDLYPQWLQLTVVRNVNGNVTHYVGFFADLSVRRQTEEQLQYLSSHDSLTELANRSMFTKCLQESTARARQHGQKVALMHVDLDRFKHINDTLGHTVADELLRQVALRLREITPEHDTLARLSADEFVIIVEHDTSRERLEYRASTILEFLRLPLKIGEHELVITASIGISEFPNSARDSLVMITQANQAMQHAKHLGGNSFQFFTEQLPGYSLERLQLENQLRKALDEDQLIVYYQPKLHLASDRIQGAEALVRWQHPEKGLLLPGAFIEMAEETGMIVALGDAVLTKACLQASEWYHRGPAPICVAVNLSVQQLRQSNFADRVQQILDHAQLPASLLEFELTESMLLEHVDAVAENIAQLQKMGIRLAIDDFGTGYSSLAYLKRFPISTLKIDRAFIGELDEQSPQNARSQDAAIIRAIIAMAHSLDLIVVAEGVEHDGQLAFLKENLCDEVQGYLISRPVPAADFTALLTESAEV